jgi:hypothetical protein|nr:MAG TPA: hypothetical protein [Caudoviricetes sp.]
MRTNVSTITYENFGQNVTSRLITSIGNLWVALARNPYGSHNLVLVTIVDGIYTAIRHGNLATINWVASEPSKDSKTKKAIRKCFEAIGVNPLANKPENRLQQLVASNHSRYLARLEAERLDRE